MKYCLSQAQLVPEVVSVLDALLAKSIQDRGLLLRHPSDTFLVVFRDVLESGAQLCRDHALALTTAETASEANDMDTRLTRSLRGFHSCLDIYLDGCKTVIKSLKEGKEQTKASRNFDAAIGKYGALVGKVENFIKHQQRAIRTVYARWGEGQIIGYQVEGVVDAEIIGSERLIHQHPGTAFSLNRALKYHACHIYLVAAALQTELKLPKPTEQKRFVEIEKKAKAFLDQVAAIPTLFFPDEQEQDVPLVRRRLDRSFILEYPSEVKPLNRKPHEMHLEFRFTPSTHALTREIPYLAKDRPWEQRR